MDKNIILAGVGGQGIVSIAFIIDSVALDAGFEFKQAEVHGMAQRGGAVQSHLRYADHEIHSDLIPVGRAHMVLSVEPLEVMRYWHYLAPDGWVVTSVTPYVNIPDYPSTERLVDELASFSNLVLVDSGELAKAAGNSRAQNMVVVGAASPLLDFSEEKLLKYVEVLFGRKGEKMVAVNRRAFQLGRAAGLMFRGLIQGGMPAALALRVCQKIAADTLDPQHSGAWVEAWRSSSSSLHELLASEGTVSSEHAATLI